ncbi:MAG: ATP-binding protein [Candidatus Heimdallarchaeota archaeon]
MSNKSTERKDEIEVLLKTVEFFESVLRESKDGILITNFNNQIITANESFCDFVGGSKLDIQGTSIYDWLENLYGKALEKWSKILSILEKEGSVSAFEFRKEEEKEMRYYSVNASLLDKLQMKESGIVLSIWRDMTDQIIQDKKLRKQERLATIGQFAGGVAHDFNNILCTIVGAIELIQDSDDADEISNFLKLILKQSDKASFLVKQILDFSKKSVIVPKEIELIPFIRDFEKIMDSIIRKNITIETEYQPISTYIDPNQLHQIFLNLILNSKDAMPKEGILRIQIKKARKNDIKDFEEDVSLKEDYVHISIEDNGIGMSEEVLSKAFEPFFTTKSMSSSTGLGLSQVYGIVRQYNGYIWVDSKPNSGTKVNIFLPEYKGEIEKEKKKLSIKKQGLILLVDDDSYVLEILKEMLERMDYNVWIASDGKEGLEKYDIKVDLIITDLIMPEMGGKQFIQEIRKQNPDAKIIALTGYYNLPIPEDVIILFKPVTRAKLESTINSIV